MNKRFKKIVAIVSAIAMVVVGITYTPSANVSAADWSDMSAWTSVTVDGTEYKITSENDWAKGFQKFDAGAYMTVASLWANFPDAAYTKAVINGTEYASSDHQDSSDTVRFMGAQVWWNPALCSKTQNTVEIYNGDTLRDTIYVYNPNGVDTEPETETDENGNVVTTAAPETTTTALQKPSAPTGLVANINDLKTNYTIAWGAVAKATSYKFYIDGTYVKDITNGAVVTIEELGLEAGQTYAFGVSAVNAAGESDVTSISVTVPAAEEATTPSESEAGEETTTEPAEEFDPSTISDWTTVTGSTTLSYYIADGAEAKVSVKPEMHGDSTIYIAYSLAAVFKSVELDGESQTPSAGAFVELDKASFTEGFHKLVVTNAYGSESVTIYFKAAAEETTTAAPYVDGAVLVDDSKTVEVPAYEGGDYWQNEFNNAPVTYVAGKKYVAEVVVSSTAQKTIKLVFQRVNVWDFVDAAAGYETTIEAGNKVKITYVFEAVQGTDNGNFDIYLGSVADATTMVFESKKLTTYNEVPDGVVTGVEVLSAPTTEYSVSVDGGTAEKVTAGGTYTLPSTATYGYACGDTLYKPGAEVTVNADMSFVSINTVTAEMADGAAVKESGAYGIAFQASVTVNGGTDLLSASYVKEGMLISTRDIYTEIFGGQLTLAQTELTVGSVKNIANDGTWFGGTTGTYRAGVTNVDTANFIRDFIATAYVQLTYVDGTTTDVYAAAPVIRSINQVAQRAQAAGKSFDNLAAYLDVE